MRRAARIDQNHTDVVRALLKAGCSVQSLAAVGCGCPDLLVWAPRLQRLVLLEVKNPDVPPSERRLTVPQQKFKKAWGGPVNVVESVTMALAVVGEYPKP